MTNKGVHVSDGMYESRRAQTTWAVTVMDEVLADAVISESRFKETMRAILHELVGKAADKFFEEHQDWIRDVFNVQQLRIAAYEHLQELIAREVAKATAETRSSHPPDTRDRTSPSTSG